MLGAIEEAVRAAEPAPRVGDRLLPAQPDDASARRPS